MLESMVSATLLLFSAILLSIAGMLTFKKMFVYAEAEHFHSQYVSLTGREPMCVSCPYKLKCPLRVDNGTCAFKIFKGEKPQC